MDQLAGLDNDELRVAGPVVCKADHLTAVGKGLYSFADRGNDPRQIAPLSRGKGSGPTLMK